MFQKPGCRNLLISPMPTSLFFLRDSQLYRLESWLLLPWHSFLTNWLYSDGCWCSHSKSFQKRWQPLVLFCFPFFFFLLNFCFFFSFFLFIKNCYHSFKLCHSCWDVPADPTKVYHVILTCSIPGMIFLLNFDWVEHRLNWTTRTPVPACALCVRVCGRERERGLSLVLTSLHYCYNSLVCGREPSCNYFF